ncbi:MAG: hypothetical protein U0175_27725 [Caldilineaceae bacterium]
MVESKRRVELWVMLLLSVFAWAPATHPGYWQALEGFLPQFNAVTLNRLATVAVAPDLWRGEGVGASLVPHLFFLLNISPTLAVRLTFIGIILGAGIGVYFWLEARLGRRGAALAGWIYILLPPFLATIYVRGSLADATVIALLPWLFWALSRVMLEQGRQGRLLYGAVFIVLMTWLWLTQAGLALLATLLLLSYAAWVMRNGWAAGLALLGGLVGAATLWPVWGTYAPAPVDFYAHFVYLFQLLRNHWQVAPSIPGWQDGYPFQLGTMALLTALLALWLWRMTNSGLAVQAVRLLAFAGSGSLILILLSLDFSIPVWQLLKADRLLLYPWQILLLAAPLLVVFAAALPTLLPEFGEFPLWSGLMLLTLAFNYNLLTTTFTALEPPLQPLATVGDNQLVILNMQINQSQWPTVKLDLGWQALQPLSFDYNFFLQARSDESTQSTGFAQFDGPPLPDRPATSWQPGEVFTATYSITLQNPPQTPPVYIFGFYDWRDGKRLPINGGQDDKMVLHGPE